ncbi:MAG: COP23 domain-containing protein [Cyanobacteria bacterium P01_G01_bin.54]
MTAERRNFAIGVAGLLVGVVTLGWAVYTERVPLQVSPKSEFICSRLSDPEWGGEVWTVLYQKPGKQPKPWLRMVEEMGAGWDTDARCGEIADRMNLYKEAGLLSFDFRPDEQTPGQYVICARTQATQGCPLVVTLLPGDEQEAFAALQRVAGALMPGNPASYQSSAEITVEQPASIPLEGML